MKIARLGDPGQEIPVVVATDSNGTEQSYDARSLTAEIDGAFLANDGLSALRKALKNGSLPILANAAELRIGSPSPAPITSSASA